MFFYWKKFTRLFPVEITHRSGLRAVVAWIGTIILTAYVVATTDVAEVWQAFQTVDLPLFLLLAVTLRVVAFVVDSATSAFAIRHCGFDVGFREFLRIKGATLLVQLVNYPLSLAAMVPLLSRRAQGRWLAASSAVGLLAMTDIAAMSVVMIAVVAIVGSPLGTEATAVLVCAAAGGVLAIPVLSAVARRGAAPRWMNRIIRSDLSEAFRLTSPRRLGAIVGVRMIWRLFGAFEMYVFVLLFRFSVPFLALPVFDSITSLVTSLPISIADIGSSLVVMRKLLTGYAPPGFAPIPAVDALSTSMVTMTVAGSLVIGVLFLPWALHEISGRNHDPEGESSRP